MNKILSENNIARFVDLLAYITISCFFLRAIFRDVQYLYTAVLLGSVVFAYQFLIKGMKVSYILATVSFIFVYSYPFTVINNGLSDGALFLPLLAGSIGIAWYISDNGLNRLYCWGLLYGSFVYFVISIFYLNKGTGDIFAYSRNHVSIYFINCACLFYIATISKNREINILPAVVALISSTVAVGFGGILSSIIFAYLIIFYCVAKKFTYYRSISLIVLVVSALVFVENIEEITLYASGVGGISGDVVPKLMGLSLIEESSRYLIMMDYLSQLDLIRTIAGVPLNVTFSGHINLHNSFLLLHARIGILSVVIAYLCVVALTRQYRNNFVLFACFLTLLIRGLTDTSFFSGSSFDFVFLFFLIFGHSTYKDRDYSYRHI